jgi:predicted outer membrane repeat protein
MKKRYTLILLLLACTLFVRTANAATWTVSNLADSGTGSLRAAITSANADSGDTIIFSVSGQIVLASALPDITSSMQIDGPGAMNLEINGGNLYRDLEVYATGDGVSMSGLKIANGSDAVDSQGGAGLNVIDGNCSVTNCDFDNDNSVIVGGAISCANDDTNLQVEDCTIVNSSAADNGGGIYFYPTSGGLNVINSTIVENYVENSESSGGGVTVGPGFSATFYGTSISSNYGSGIDNEGSITVNDCLLNANDTGDTGGAIYNDGTASVTSSTISDNQSSSTGGAIISFDALTVSGTLFSGNMSGADGGAIDSEYLTSITNCEFENNEAGPGGTGSGGAITQLGGYGGSVIATNCTFSGNTAVGDGGAIYSGDPLQATADTFSTNSSEANGGAIDCDSTIALVDDTLFENSSTTGGGALYNDTNGITTAANCTLYLNATNGDGAGIDNISTSSTALAAANCIIYDSTSNELENSGGGTLLITSSDVAGGYSGSGNINAPPLLGALGSYGGVVQTLPILPGSPCFGAGVNASVTSDARGVAIPQSGSRYDIGAFESQGFTIAATSGTPQSAIDGAAFAKPLIATVTPVSSVEPVVGGIVTFSAPTSGASAVLTASAETISSTGVVQDTATANTVVGTYQVTAATSGKTAAFTLTTTQGTVPKITSFTPTSGPVGTSVTVTGSGFSGASAVSVDGYPATFTFVSDSTITLVVPTGASTGAIHIKNPQGLGASSTNFTVTAAPTTVTSFSPTSGPVGTTVTITGTALSGATAVSLDGYPASFTVVSNTSITFTVPKGAATGAIHVKTASTLAASSTNFTVTAPASINSFSPSSGPVGTKITITGVGFTGATAASVGGYPGSFTVVNDTTVTLTVPSGAKSGSVHVQTPSGLAASTASFAIVGVPVISSFTPTSGPVGTVISVTGSSFTGTTAASVDGVPASFTVNSDSSISVTVPSGASTGAIHIKNAQGLGASTTNFTVN